ncbi:hypothetical protein [Alistipes sp. ZOR0009]|uniref:hypothetical protein n=1 Tax=Alistipes sp. ZOR0009 TaxID=1339253 RepID=UPI001E395CC2|nr:hypothetical protein [Alistipes sp. ZOR0009]
MNKMLCNGDLGRGGLCPLFYVEGGAAGGWLPALVLECRLLRIGRVNPLGDGVLPIN